MNSRKNIDDVYSNIPWQEGTTRKYGISTLAVHAGARPDPVTGARSTPIYQTTSFVFDDAEHGAELFNLQTFGYVYSRMTNPTVSVFEERLAQLEGGRGAVATASGHAAQFLTAVTLMESGEEFISSRNLYGGSVTQFGVSFPKLGWKCHFVDPTDPENFENANRRERQRIEDEENIENSLSDVVEDKINEKTKDHMDNTTTEIGG